MTLAWWVLQLTVLSTSASAAFNAPASPPVTVNMLSPFLNPLQHGQLHIPPDSLLLRQLGRLRGVDIHLGEGHARVGVRYFVQSWAEAPTRRRRLTHEGDARGL